MSEESSKAHNIIMELRKAANHPLLLLHHYTNSILRQMSQDILSESAYHDADPNLVYEDMRVMADFELHRLCLSYPVLHKYCISPTLFEESGKLKFLAGKLDKLKMEVFSICVLQHTTL
jgi:SWI/SNF-related matrix-associated actin-dependent regulator 1 of chromatin subfamily A